MEKAMISFTPITGGWLHCRKPNGERLTKGLNQREGLSLVAAKERMLYGIFIQIGRAKTSNWNIIPFNNEGLKILTFCRYLKYI